MTKTILIYSYNGTANIDVRIQSQAIFLSKKHKVTIFEPCNNKKLFDWKKYNINYIIPIVKYRDLVNNVQLLDEKLNYYYVHFCKKFTNKYILRILKILNKITVRLPLKILYKTASLLRTKINNNLLEELKPDIIISRDLSSRSIIKYKKKNPHTKIINDLHEIIYYQKEKEDKKLKKLQNKHLKYSSKIINVTKNILEEYYHEYKNKTIVIPNTPCASLVPKIELKTNLKKETHFLIHGGYIQERDYIIDELCKIWHKTNKNAFLHVRLLGSSNIVHLKKYKSDRIIFEKPVYGGITNEITETINKFDIGILPIPIDLSPMYKICSPNRLAVYLHSGLALLHTDSFFVKNVRKQANCGYTFNYKDERQTIKKINELCIKINREKLKKNAFKYARNEFYYENFAEDLLKNI